MKSGPSALVEKSRIAKAMRDSTLRGFKIQEPMECVRDAVAQFGRSVSVACSFGSCSVVVLHMALQVDPDILVVFNNSVAGYSPVVIRHRSTGLIDVLPLEDLWDAVPSPIILQRCQEIKVIDGVDLLSGSPDVWTPIKHILRHSYRGALVRVITGSGLVDTSPNHSLIRAGGEVVDAEAVCVGHRLAMPINIRPNEIFSWPFFVGSREIARFLGIFCAEGSAYYNNSNGGYITSIANKDVSLLEKTEEIMTQEFHVTPRIDDAGSGVSVLRASSRGLYRYVISQCCTQGMEKRVPVSILNAPDLIQSDYFEWYMKGDGHYHSGRYPQFATRSQTLGLGLSLLCRKLGYESYGIHNYENKPDAYHFWINRGKKRTDPRQVVRTYKVQYSGHLYDLETKDHSFCTGLGPIRAHNTGVEYPETLRYKEMLVKDWKLNLVETKPVKSFWKCVEEYGFPLLRGKRSKKYGNPGKPPCCRFLKEIPMREAAKKHGIRAVITGLRAAESRARMFAFAQLGQNYASHKFFDIVKFNPIAFWTHDELWKYIRAQGLPVNPIYKKVARSGCMPCTGYTNWEAQLAKANPRMYRYVQRLRGVALFEDFLSLEEARVVSPCASTEPAKLTEWF